MLGLDEIALKKGHRDFVTIVTARLADGQVVLLGVLPNREKETVIAFLRSIPERLCQTIRSVCCDMCEGFTEAVREELKTACIVVDRFHVTRYYHQAADDLRQSELHPALRTVRGSTRLKQELPPEEYQLLKGSMWAFRKKSPDLRPEERQVLRRLFGYAPKLKQAYDLRQQLTAIFDQMISPAVAKRKIRNWIQRVKISELRCFDAFLKTLEHWWEEIIHYFVDRESSGFIEGLKDV